MYETTLETLLVIAKLGALVPAFAALYALAFDSHTHTVHFAALDALAMPAKAPERVRIAPASLASLAPVKTYVKPPRRTSCASHEHACDPSCCGLFVNNETGKIERCDSCDLHESDAHAARHARKCALCHLACTSQGYRFRSPRKRKTAKVSVRVLNAADAQTLGLCVAQAFAFSSMRQARAFGSV